jgi:type VII secretion protein EccB
MPANPTSKSQVQAYRFVLRRMQSALVRRDPVLAHDPMRTHSKATLIGAIVAAVALAGVGVYGLLRPAPTLPDKQGIVVSQQSGQVYVLRKQRDGSRKLIPTFNLASARLLLAAQQQQRGPDQREAGSPAPVSADKAVAAKPVDESQLQGVPVGRLTGIPSAPAMLPSGRNQLATGRWGVCDDIQRNERLPDPTSAGTVTTTVLAGVAHLGSSLPKGQSLLVKSKDGATYLVYRTPTTVNKPQAEAVRAKVNVNDTAVRATFDPNNVRARRISDGLLNAIPPVPDLTVPRVPGPAKRNAFGLGVPTGGVVAANTPGKGRRYYLILPDGQQEVSKSVATLVRAHNSHGSLRVKTVPLDKITDVPTSRHQIDELRYFPDTVPEVLEPGTYPTVCLGWRADVSDPEQPKEHTVVTVGTGAPLPHGAEPISLAEDGESRRGIDRFYMPPGHAAVIRAAQSPADFTRGPIFLVGDRGVSYGIPDVNTAAILGFGKKTLHPAPASIVGMLPSGAELSVQRVQREFDTPPDSVAAGHYRSAGPRAGAPGSAQSGGG